MTDKYIALEMDDDEQYYLVVEDDELGPLTREELRIMTNCCASEFGQIGEF